MSSNNYNDHPCDAGKCPYDAIYYEHCRFYCGLGVDEDEEDYEYEEEYVPSAENGDYSPSAPWRAPGMSVKDFI